MSSPSRIGRRAQSTTANELLANKHTQGNHPSPETREQEIVSSGTGVTSPEFNDSGFFENEDSNTPRVDYQDFVLFSNVDPTLEAYNFFADADASVVVNHGSVAGSNNETVRIERSTSYASQRNPPCRSDDAVREAATFNKSVLAVVDSNYDARSQSGQLKCPPTPYLRPLELWERTFERHESIAYRFEQPPHIVRSQNSRQQRG